MTKAQRYELLYVKFLWVFLIFGLCYNFLFNNMEMAVHGNYTGIFYDIIYSAAMSIWILAKYWLVKKGFLERNNLYLINRALGLFLMSLTIIYFNVGQWAYIITVFSILITSLTKGSKLGLWFTLYSFCVQALIMLIKVQYDSGAFIATNTNYAAQHYVILIIFYSIVAMFSVLCGKIYNENMNNEKENKRLLEELEEKYDQIAVAQDEIQFHYEKLKTTNKKLEETNEKLTANIAEFYTLQQITQAIGSILDISELLKYVNDIILGVMGVNNSSIILMDEKEKVLKVERTNIKSEEELLILRENIDCNILLSVLNNGKPIVENFVDPDVYVFTKGRDVNSLICVPLSSKTKKYGLVLVEHKYFNAFDEDNMRFLDIIGQQVGIAMENAELYQKMHEMATIDGLTGVYNRLYFQQRLQNEFDSAKEGGYELSLAIFDVDFFKAFNDTYGHLFGDKVIRSIAELAKGSLRPDDVIARFGGEEFVILYPRTDIKEAAERIEALRSKIASAQVKDNLVSTSITASFGVSSYPEFALTESELLRSADNALYIAKSSGRNCVRLAKDNHI